MVRILCGWVCVVYPGALAGNRAPTARGLPRSGFRPPAAVPQSESRVGGVS